MKRTSFSPYKFAIIPVALLLLVACERPIPRDLTPAVTEVVPPATTPIVETTVVPGATEPYPGPGPAEPTPGAVETPATPQPEPTAVPATGETVHVVQPGETLFRISQQYGVSVDAIAAANGITNVNQLDVGQQLIIPSGDTAGGAPPPATGEQTHVVQPGENLYRIALRYGLTVAELAQYNGIANPNQIEVGQVIRIPPGN